MSEREDIDLESLEALPIFPLPSAVLLPGTFISLHVFEPRYRQMAEDCINGHRMMMLVMNDETGPIDAFDRPAVHAVGGLGALRRSACLPSGNYNVVLEGLARARIVFEHAPSRLYRKVKAHVLDDVFPDDPRELEQAESALRALCARVLPKMPDIEEELIQGLSQITEPGRLADTVAMATMTDRLERQRVLDATNIVDRLRLVSGLLGAELLARDDGTDGWGWGMAPADA